MTLPARIDAAIQRDMLQVAVRNSRRSIALLVLAAGFVAWLGWQAGDMLAASLTAGIGAVVAWWRWSLARRFDPQQITEAMENTRTDRVVRELEANALLVGVMWVVATLVIYPVLKGITASVYLVIVCGSVATAAFFMSMAGRSFVILSVLQLGALVLASLFIESSRSVPLAVLSVLFGITMHQATREFRRTAMRSMRHSYEADEANSSLMRAKEAAEAANLAKSQFLATMSHEIRTPMNGVLGALDLLRQTPLESRQRRLVKTAAASGESLMDILNDVLDHSKIEAGKLMLVAVSMSLNSVVASAAALFRANAEGRGLTITLHVGDGVPDAVIGDAPRLKQVLLNLIGNGVKFTESGGITVRLSASPAGPDASRVRFEVEDTGIGIPAAALQQVFLPFHQIDNSSSRLRGGTGLGLAISERIVRAMGGRIEVHSRIGIGSTFSFELILPLARQAPPRDNDSGFGELADGPQTSGTVLLVEDNIVNRMIAAEMLKSLGVDVLEAEDGAQALQVLERQHVDLVLMDIQMPVLDGYAATRQAREREARLRLPRVPIVALTANAFDEDATLAMAAGMDGHLAKPYSRAALRNLLQRWL